jgi:L-cysteine S-thiosulfotransferase
MRNANGTTIMLVLAAAIAIDAGSSPGEGGGLAIFEIVGDAIPAPLGGLTGDAVRGLAIIRDRSLGNCLICHAAPLPDEKFQGEIGPSLAGVGSRLSPGQIRLRLVDQSRFNPNTLMPPYYRVDGLSNVAPEYIGRPALDAQQVEDVIVYLAGLKE